MITRPFRPSKKESEECGTPRKRRLVPSTRAVTIRHADMPSSVNLSFAPSWLENPLRIHIFHGFVKYVAQV